MTISRDSIAIRPKSQGGAFPVWSGSEAMPVWRDMSRNLRRDRAGEAEGARRRRLVDVDQHVDRARDFERVEAPLDGPRADPPEVVHLGEPRPERVGGRGPKVEREARD